jgi:hypothetical protein
VRVSVREPAGMLQPGHDQASRQQHAGPPARAA